MIARLAGQRALRAFLLDCGTLRVTGSGPERVIGIPAWLIETDGGARILVDGGFPAPYWADAETAAARDGLAGFGRLEGYGSHQTLPGQLALLGLGAQDIDLQVLTHGHVDHVGALGWLACPLVLGAAERAMPRPAYYPGAAGPDWPDVPTLTVTGPAEVVAGLALIPTPGHTPGHLSLRLDLPGAPPLFIAADAISRRAEITDGIAEAADPAAAARSLAHLVAAARAAGGRLLPGHEPEDLHRLPRAPLPFDPAAVPPPPG